MSTSEHIPTNKISLYSKIIRIIIDLLIIFGPPACYYSQALKFKKTQSSKGFSKTLCLLLILTNILRIIFWIGKPFSISLFYQSFLIILSQFYLIHIYLKYQEKPTTTESPKKTLLDHITNWKDIFNLSKTWDYSCEVDYYKFIFLLVSVFSIICYFIGIKNTKFYECVGVVSVSIETFIEIPQIKENCIVKNTKNLSAAMVFMWLIGDLFKGSYNIIYKNPIQIIIGSLLQICEDLTLMSQIFLYGDIGPFCGIFKKNYKFLGSDENQGSENDLKNNDIDSLNDDIIVLSEDINYENNNKESNKIIA